MTSISKKIPFFLIAIIVLSVSVLGNVENGSTRHKTIPLLSIEEINEDFSVAVRTLKEFHPGLFRYGTPEEFEKRIDAYRGRLKKPMPANRFFGLIGQFLNEIKCYHTHLNPFNQNSETKAMLLGGKTYFPFYFELVNKRMIVTANASSGELSIGSEITKINGVAVRDIIDRLLTVTNADGDGNLASRIESIEVNRANGTNYALFDIYFPIFFEIPKQTFKIEAKDFRSGKKLGFKVPALTGVERGDVMEKRYGPESGYDEGWSFGIDKNGTAILRMAHFITWKLSFKYQEFLRKAFEESAAKGAKRLVIDIRGNGGGDSTVARETFRYISKDKLPCESGFTTYIKTAKANPELLLYATTYEPLIKNALEKGLPSAAYREASNGDLLEFLPDNAACDPIEPYETRFSGPVFLITGAENASAAFSFAQTAKKRGLAKIVGQATGGNKRGFNGGSYLFINLPNSKFEFDIPLFGYYSDRQEPDEGVVPDTPVEQRIEDIGNGFDREMDTIKKYSAAN